MKTLQQLLLFTAIFVTVGCQNQHMNYKEMNKAEAQEILVNYINQSFHHVLNKEIDKAMILWKRAEKHYIAYHHSTYERDSRRGFSKAFIETSYQELMKLEELVTSKEIRKLGRFYNKVMLFCILKTDTGFGKPRPLVWNPPEN